MSGAEFDKYVGEYRDIINRVSSISGEQFEFFIQFRLRLMQACIAEMSGHLLTTRILDFGCGTGTTELYLKEFFPGALIYAIDSSVESIRIAIQRNLNGVTFIHSDSILLPFPDNYFDLIYSNGTFHHIEAAQHVNIVSEIARVSRPGGNFFVFENNPRNPLMMRAMRNNPFDEDAKVLYPEQLREVMKASGFIDNEVVYYFFFPRFLRFMRYLEKWLCHIPYGAQYFLRSTKI